LYQKELSQFMDIEKLNKSSTIKCIEYVV